MKKLLRNEELNGQELTGGYNSQEEGSLKRRSVNTSSHENGRSYGTVDSKRVYYTGNHFTLNESLKNR